MDTSYFEANYIDLHYTTSIYSITNTMEAFSLVDLTLRVIHLMDRLSYKIREETRLYEIREETRLRQIAEETRTYKIKEG